MCICMCVIDTCDIWFLRDPEIPGSPDWLNYLRIATKEKQIHVVRRISSRKRKQKKTCEQKGRKGRTVRKRNGRMKRNRWLTTVEERRSCPWKKEPGKGREMKGEHGNDAPCIRIRKWLNRHTFLSRRNVVSSCLHTSYRNRYALNHRYADGHQYGGNDPPFEDSPIFLQQSALCIPKIRTEARRTSFGSLHLSCSRSRRSPASYFTIPGPPR